MSETELRGVSEEQRCIWPGCARPRAAGRTSGSGRQKEYCLQADPPEAGGGPVHNARNRWAALHGTGGQDATAPEPAGSARTGTGGTGEAALVVELSPFSQAKRRASDLLDQTRRQHADALASLRAEREIYQRLSEELAALADPAAVDLEIATVAARTGRQVAQAEQEAADARRAQLAAERDRDAAHQLRDAAEAAAGQLTDEVAAAERLLAQRSAEFESERQQLRERTAAAERSAADAARQASEAGRRADAADDRARTAAAAAAASVAAALRERDAASAEAATARAVADQLRATADRDRAIAERDRGAAALAVAAARADAHREREIAGRAREEAVSDRAATARSAARVTAVETELARLRDEVAERRESHAAELARLTAAQESAVNAERARARRAEAELDAFRASQVDARK